MCIICRDYQLGKLTAIEAKRNLGEMDPKTEAEVEHLVELFGLLNRDQKAEEALYEIS